MTRFEEVRDRLSTVGVIVASNRPGYALHLGDQPWSTFIVDCLDEALRQGMELAERASKQPKLSPMGPLGTPTSRGKRIAHNRRLWAKRAREAKTGEPYREGDEFYKSREWLDLRYKVLKERGARCECCGKTRKDLDDAGEPVVIQVDHVKPRSTHPELELDPKNCQLACKDCNQGKGWKDETDWR